MTKYWTKQEADSLKKLWKSGTWEELQKAIPNRTKESIKTKANRISLKRNTPQSNLKSQYNIEKVKDRQLLEEVSKRGYIAYKQKLKQDAEYKYDKRVKTYKLGIISDTHYGSKHQQHQHLLDFYRLCKHFKVDAILHGGDVVEGNGKLYRGQLYEMFMFGVETQLDYIVNNYPKIEGIKTYVIGGSHDYSFYKESGFDILQHFADERSDIEYLGYTGAYITFGKIVIYLMHGSGGIAYARSYKMQKIIEQFAPEQKPHILLLGHYHQPAYLEAYRNVEGFQLKCFQSQTTYLKTKGYFPAIGGMILTIHQSNKGLESIEIYNKTYYVPVKNDYISLPKKMREAK